MQGLILILILFLLFVSLVLCVPLVLMLILSFIGMMAFWLRLLGGNTATIIVVVVVVVVVRCAATVGLVLCAVLLRPPKGFPRVSLVANCHRSPALPSMDFA